LDDICIDIVVVLDIFANNTDLQLGCNSVESDNETLMIYMNEVNHEISLGASLRFTMCLLDANMNLFALSVLIGMMICFLEDLLIIILILGLGLSALPNISIFLFKSLGKFFLIFKMLLMFLEET